MSYTHHDVAYQLPLIEGELCRYREWTKYGGLYFLEKKLNVLFICNLLEMFKCV